MVRQSPGRVVGLHVMWQLHAYPVWPVPSRMHRSCLVSDTCNLGAQEHLVLHEGSHISNAQQASHRFLTT